MRLLILFERFGPYHHARLKAIGKLMETLALEISATDETYAWEKVEGSNGFKKITLLDKPRTRESNSVLFKKIKLQIDQFKPDAIAVTGWSTSWSLFTLNHAFSRRIPVVMMSDSQKTDFQRFSFVENLKKEIVKLCAAGLAGGTPHKEYLKDLGIPEENIFATCSTVDNEYFQKMALQIRRKRLATSRKLGLPKKYFLSSFRFIEKKNPFRLLEAFSLYRNSAKKKWKLILVGDGPLKETIEKKIQALKLQGEVLLPGFKQYDELPAFYALASAFILPSTSEQWGLVVNEAMASGLPVLVSERCGCALDLVQQGKNGFIFNPYNEEELASLMGMLSSGKLDLKRMGRRSQEIVKDWSPEKFALGLKAACEKAVTSYKRPKDLLTFFFWGSSNVLNRLFFQRLVGFFENYILSRRKKFEITPPIPNFFIIGAPKSGTSSLSEYLKTHPNVFFSRAKEPHFFDTDMSQSLKISMPIYLNLFVNANPDIHKAIGEGSTGYLFSKNAAGEILKFNPNSKFIAMLRNPVDLVPSWHSEMYFEGIENIPDFDQAWEAEKDRRNGKKIPIACTEPRKLFYSDWGKLGEQMERLYSIVPKERVKVILFDDFVSDTKKTYEEVLHFLGLPSDGRSVFEPINERKELRVRFFQQVLAVFANGFRMIRAKSGLNLGLGIGLFPHLLLVNSRIAKRKPISPGLKKELCSYYRSDIQKLSRYLGRDLSNWTVNLEKS